MNKYNMKQSKNNSFWSPIKINSIKVAATNPLFSFPKNSSKPMPISNLKSVNFFNGNGSRINNNSKLKKSKNSPIFNSFNPYATAPKLSNPKPTIHKYAGTLKRNINPNFIGSINPVYKPISPIKSNINVPRRQMNWFQAKSKFPKLNPFGDADRDGVINMLDCKPFNKAMQDAKSRAYFKKLREDENNRKKGLLPMETREFMRESIGENVEGGFAKLINDPKVKKTLQKIKEGREREALQMRKQALKNKISPKKTQNNINAIRKEKKEYEKDFEESDRRALDQWDKDLMNAQLKKSLNDKNLNDSVDKINKSKSSTEKSNNLKKTGPVSLEKEIPTKGGSSLIVETISPEMKKETEIKQEKSKKKYSITELKLKLATKEKLGREKILANKEIELAKIKDKEERQKAREKKTESVAVNTWLRAKARKKESDIEKFKADTRAATKIQLAQLQFGEAQLKSQASLVRNIAAIKGMRGSGRYRKEPWITPEQDSASIDKLDKQMDEYEKETIKKNQKAEDKELEEIFKIDAAQKTEKAIEKAKEKQTKKEVKEETKKEKKEKKEKIYREVDSKLKAQELIEEVADIEGKHSSQALIDEV
jgi:hypothetical protein